MAFKMRGWNAFTRKTDPPKANMPEVKVTPEMQDDRDYNIKDFIKDLVIGVTTKTTSKKGRRHLKKFQKRLGLSGKKLERENKPLSDKKLKREEKWWDKSNRRKRK